MIPQAVKYPVQYEMNLANRNIALVAILMLLIILLPVVTRPVLTGGDDLPGDDHYLQVRAGMAVWAKMQDHQILLGIMVGISVFVFIVVYLGGRLNQRRFNDRIIDSIDLIRDIFFRDGSLKSRFCCLSIDFGRIRPHE